MNLTKEQEALLNTEFPAELEKEAAEQVSTLNELYEMGFCKMAAAAADEMDKEESDGCPDCGLAYSFVFNCQFHKKDCPSQKDITKKNTS